MSDKIDTLLKEGRIFSLRPHPKRRHISRIMTRPIRPPSPTRSFLGWRGWEWEWFTPGLQCWVELPLGRGSSARPATSPTTVSIATPMAGGGTKSPSSGWARTVKKRIFTYGELLRQVNRCANALKALGLKPSDRVTIYLPKILEQVVAMLACARIESFTVWSIPGSAHRPWPATSGCGSTAGHHLRTSATTAGKRSCSNRGGRSRGMPYRGEGGGRTTGRAWRRPTPPKEIDWADWLKEQSAVCAAEPLDAKPSLYFVHLGNDRKAKGVVHVHGGYMVGTYITTKYVFDLKEDDVYFVVAPAG